MKSAAKKKSNLLYDPVVIKNGREILKALDHPLRLKMLQMIEHNGEVMVSEIYRKLKIEQSLTSQHLSLLRQAGVVSIRQEGKCRYYSVNHKRLKQIESLALSLKGGKP